MLELLAPPRPPPPATSTRAGGGASAAGEFGVQSISQMLGNEKYVGVYSWGDVRVEGGMPAIIERGTWDRLGKLKARGTQKA